MQILAGASVAASSSTWPPVDVLTDCVLRDDLSGFAAAVQASLKAGGYARARKQIQDAAAGTEQRLDVFALRCLVELASKHPRDMQAVALLSELGPTSPSSNGKAEMCAVEPQTAARELAVMDGDLLKIAVRVLHAWGAAPDASGLTEVTRSTLAAAVLREAKNGGSGPVAAAGALSSLPGLLADSAEPDRMMVLEAAEGDGGREDVAERLARSLGRAAQLRLVRLRQESRRARSAARAVHAFGLEADFPDADFEWRSEAIASALRHGHREAIVGLAFCEVRLRAQAVSGLLELGHFALAAELAGAWELPVPVEAELAAAEQRSELRRAHLCLPEAVQVQFVDTEAALPDMVAALLAARAIGLDVEWRPAEGSPPCLLQLATDEAAFLIDLIRLGTSQALGDALREVASASTVTKVGFDGGSDLGRTAKAYPALAGVNHAAPLVDVRNLEVERRVREEGVSKKQAKEGISLSALAQRHLGLPLDKTMQMSDWGRRPLSAMQVHYAALDAWAPLQICAALSP